MQALKILVVVMGLGIVALFTVIVVVLVQRVGGGDGDEAEGLGEITFDLPAGCRLAEATAAEGRLVLRLDGPVGEGCQQAVLIDLESGRLIGRVTATPVP